MLLTDIVMPEMDGLELLKEIRSNPMWDSLGVIVATSYKEKTKQPALELGADDVEINVAVMEAALSEQFEIISASNGIEALKLIKSNTDVVAIITDIQMPNMNGLDLIKRIREI